VRGLPLIVLLAVIAPSIAAAADVVRIELNTTESVQNRCRSTFVIENKSERQIESLKLDLVVFGTDNTMQRRMVVELGPVRRSKTIVRTYEIERDCAQIGAILVNDVAACAPGDPGTCLDELALSSRSADIKLYK